MHSKLGIIPQGKDIKVFTLAKYDTFRKATVMLAIFKKGILNTAKNIPISQNKSTVHFKRMFHFCHQKARKELE